MHKLRVLLAMLAEGFLRAGGLLAAFGLSALLLLAIATGWVETGAGGLMRFATVSAMMVAAGALPMVARRWWPRDVSLAQLIGAAAVLFLIAYYGVLHARGMALIASIAGPSIAWLDHLLLPLAFFGAAIVCLSLAADRPERTDDPDDSEPDPWI